MYALPTYTGAITPLLPSFRATERFHQVIMRSSWHGSICFPLYQTYLKRAWDCLSSEEQIPKATGKPEKAGNEMDGRERNVTRL